MRGTRARRGGGANSFNFMHFLGKFGKIICWRPHLGEILDPPLLKHLFNIIKDEADFISGFVSFSHLC